MRHGPTHQPHPNVQARLRLAWSMAVDAPPRETRGAEPHLSKASLVFTDGLWKKQPGFRLPEVYIRV